jgi:endonuclease/exonuclease/phosphatase family metal-dependent hydrolase
MAGNFASLAKRVFVLINLLAAFVFLIACYGPYLNPQFWWFLLFLGLGFPILFIVIIFFIFFWILFSPRYIFISIAALLLGWKGVSVFLAVRPIPDFNLEKPKDVIRVVHWNVARFVEWRRNNNKGSQIRLRMMDLIKRQNADVLCFSEFYHSTNPEYYDNLNYVMKDLGYPYFYFSWDDDGGDQWAGQAIFSRHPIIDSGIVRFPKPGIQESLIYADVVFQKDTLRFYTMHLQSVQFKKTDYDNIEKIKNRDDSLLETSRGILSKLKRATIIRSRQADMVREALDSCPYTPIVTGDFNDVPNSYTYYTISDNLQDAFLKKSFGVGRTFSGISPTLRIDYILAANNLSVLQFDRHVRKYSDHYMLVADFKIKPPVEENSLAKDSSSTKDSTSAKMDSAASKKKK